MNKVALTLESNLVPADELEAVLEVIKPILKVALHSETVEFHIVILEED